MTLPGRAVHRTAPAGRQPSPGRSRACRAETPGRRRRVAAREPRAVHDDGVDHLCSDAEAAAAAQHTLFDGALLSDARLLPHYAGRAHCSGVGGLRRKVSVAASQAAWQLAGTGRRSCAAAGAQRCARTAMSADGAVRRALGSSANLRRPVHKVFVLRVGHQPGQRGVVGRRVAGGRQVPVHLGRRPRFRPRFRFRGYGAHPTASAGRRISRCGGGGPPGMSGHPPPA